jgi:5-methylcytosine-specific restriction endonuclease McrA
MEDSGEDKPAAGPEALGLSVLVLNRFYNPINVVTARRAFILLYKENAEAIDTLDAGFTAYRIGDWIGLSGSRYGSNGGCSEFVRTPRYAVMVPRIIRLFACASLPKHEVKFTKRNVLVRDAHRCQYCGRRQPASRLTVDHVVPRSRGGRSSWTNIVAACIECNTRKGGKLPWEVGMKLVRPPGVPRKNPAILDKARMTRYRAWLSFVRE